MYEILNIPNNKVKIMIALEAVFPDLNLFDYAITFCNHFSCYDRVLHIPYLEYLSCIGYKYILDRIDEPKIYEIAPQLTLNRGTMYQAFSTVLNSLDLIT